MTIDIDIDLASDLSGFDLLFHDPTEEDIDVIDTTNTIIAEDIGLFEVSADLVDIEVIRMLINERHMDVYVSSSPSWIWVTRLMLRLHHVFMDHKNAVILTPTTSSLVPPYRYSLLMVMNVPRAAMDSLPFSLQRFTSLKEWQLSREGYKHPFQTITITFRAYTSKLFPPPTSAALTSRLPLEEVPIPLDMFIPLHGLWTRIWASMNGYDPGNLSGYALFIGLPVHRIKRYRDSYYLNDMIGYIMWSQYLNDH